MLHTKDQAYKNQLIQNQYIIIENKCYKHNDELSYVGMYSPSENLRSHLKIRNIKPKQAFDKCNFERCYFHNVDLSEIGFINCSFVGCIFDGCTNNNHTNINLAFLSCSFQMCRFADCNFWNVVTFACCFFNKVLFKNSSLLNSCFSQCCFADLRFLDNCDLSGANFLSPSGCFHIQFITSNGYTKINKRTRIDDFVYNETGFDDLLAGIGIIGLDKALYTMDGFNNFLVQMKKNKLPKHHYDCFYKYKKAETRTKKGYRKYFGILLEWLFGYCEKPWRITWAMIFVIIISSFLYMISGFDTGEKYIRYVFDPSRATFNFEYINDYISSLYFSFYTFFTVGGWDFKPASVWSKAVFSAELICGVVLITLFTTTIVRRLTR